MAIRLMREKDVPTTTRDLVFRASRVYAVLFVLACLGACGAMIALHWPRPNLAYYLSGLIVLLLLLIHQLITARFHPSNWLVRTADDGLFIHFRSYLNDRLSPEDPTVAFLAYSDIRSARLVRERLTALDSEGAKTVQTRRLVNALATECGRPGAPENPIVPAPTSGV